MKQCAHCGIEGKPIDVMPYYTTAKGVVWLHPRCSREWHEAHR